MYLLDEVEPLMNLKRQKNIRKRHKRLFLYFLLEVLGFLLGIVIFGYLTVVSLRVAFNADYVQISGLFLGFIFCLITLLFLVLLFFYFWEKDIISASCVIRLRKKIWKLVKYPLVYIAVFCFIISISIFREKDEYNDFVGITMTQIGDSEILIRRMKNESKIIINSKEYPDFCFQIDDVYMKYMDSDNYVNNVKSGDTLTVMISKESYDKKIAKTKSLSFADKKVNYHLINICGLKHKNFELLSTEDCKNAKKSNSVFNTLFFSAFGIGFLYFQWKFYNE